VQLEEWTLLQPRQFQVWNYGLRFLLKKKFFLQKKKKKETVKEELAILKAKGRSGENDVVC
jgi:hypothetical protein